jgi:hypothetical protein
VCDVAVPPSLVVAVGDARHVYWTLREPLGRAELEQANHALAARLGGDPSGASYLARPPGTFDFDQRPPRPVLLESVRIERDPTAAEVLRKLS